LSAYVLDASVAAKWILPQSGETLVPQAEHLLQRFTDGAIQLVVPDLFWAEIGSILWKAVRAGRTSKAWASSGLETLLRQNLPTFPSGPLLDVAFAIALNHHQTVYDCLYVALALESKRSLLTADERLASGLAAHFPVRWLGSLY
jgi:predicted nucleic acid-binding protein